MPDRYSIHWLACFNPPPLPRGMIKFYPTQTKRNPRRPRLLLAYNNDAHDDNRGRQSGRGGGTWGRMRREGYGQTKNGKHSNFNKGDNRGNLILSIPANNFGSSLTLPLRPPTHWLQFRCSNIHIANLRTTGTNKLTTRTMPGEEHHDYNNKNAIAITPLFVVVVAKLVRDQWRAVGFALVSLGRSVMIGRGQGNITHTAPL